MSSDIPVKILFLAADPINTSRLRLGQELRDIKERLRRATSQNYQLEQRESVRVRDIIETIDYVKPNIIHFSGHGTSKGELCFENEEGTVQPVAPDALAKTFELFKTVRCVVLNACYSEIQAKAIFKHIPFVIGINNEIDDQAAIAFSRSFYGALVENHSIKDAYDRACSEMALENIAQHIKPVFLRKKTRTTTQKLRNEKAITNPFKPYNGRVEDPQLFFGRDREMRRVFEVLKSGSSVALIGEEGMGKSSLLWAIRQQAETYLQPPRQAVFLDLNQVDNEDDFYRALCNEVGIPESTGYELSRNLRSHKVLLALDNVGKMTWQGFTRRVRDQLRGLAEGSNASLKMILAATEPLNDLFHDSQDEGKTSPLAGICQEEHIQPWDETTMRAFIANRLAGTDVSFTEEEIIQLLHLSGGNPQRLVEQCYQTFVRYVEVM